MNKEQEKKLLRKAINIIGVYQQTAMENASGINESDEEIMEGCEEDEKALSFAIVKLQGLLND